MLIFLHQSLDGLIESKTLCYACSMTEQMHFVAVKNGHEAVLTCLFIAADVVHQEFEICDVCYGKSLVIKPRLDT